MWTEQLICLVNIFIGVYSIQTTEMVKMSAVSVMKDANGWRASQRYNVPILMSPSHLSCCWKLLADRQSPFLFDLLGIFIFPWITSTNVPQATQRFQGQELINRVIATINLRVIKIHLPLVKFRPPTLLPTDWQSYTWGNLQSWVCIWARKSFSALQQASLGLTRAQHRFAVVMRRCTVGIWQTLVFARTAAYWSNSPNIYVIEMPRNHNVA